MQFQLSKIFIVTFLLLFFSFGISSAKAQKSHPCLKITDEEPEENSISEDVPVKETQQRKNEIQLSFFNESLTNGYGDWRTVSLDFKRSFDNRAVFYGFIQASRRNEFHDREVMLGFYKPINKKWSVTVEGTISPTHKFVGKYSGTAKIERIFSRGWVGSIGVRSNQYNIVKATSTQVGVEKYWKSYRAAYALNVTHLQNSGTSAGNRFSFNKYYGEDNNSVGVNAGFGREIENLGTRILQSNTASASVSWRQWLNPHWGITADASIHKQDKLYYRRGVYVGLRFRF